MNVLLRLTPPPPQFLNRLALLTVLIFLLSPLTVHAADINVDSDCTLAQAIESANTDTVPTGSTCEKGDGTDTITIPVGSTIILSADLPDISTDMTINGNVADISGGDDRRAFKITGGTVTLDSINATGTATGSNDEDKIGGAILVTGGTVTLSSVNITGSHTTNGGALAITGGSVSYSGGQIDINTMNPANDWIWGAGVRLTGSGSLTINNSSITNNIRSGTTYAGGGLYAASSGALTISNSYFAGNEGTWGAAIYLDGGQNGNVTVVNTTIYNNRAVGGNPYGTYAGIFMQGLGTGGATYTFRHITLSNNFGDHLGSGSQFRRNAHGNKNIVLANSIIDSPNSSDDCQAGGSGGSGTWTFTNNLVQDGSCSPSVSGDPLLLALAGAGASRHRPLNDISPAIGAGNDAQCAINGTDQNGDTRPATGCDLGAKENALTGQQSQGTATAYGNQTATSVQATANFVGTETMMAKDTATQAQQYVNETATMEANILGTARALQKKKQRRKEAEATLTALAVPTATPTQAATCENMGNGVTVTGLAGGNAPQCNIMPASVRGDVVANDEIHAAGGYIDAVDIWGWIGAGVEVCFDQPGGLVFLDASTAPRTLYRISSYVGVNGITCAFIDREGTVVLMHENLISPGWPLAPWEAPEVLAAAPAAAPVAEGAAPSSSSSTSPYQALSGCMVRTEYGLYFRVSPDGPLTVPQTVPYNVTLTALERTAAWFHVDYHGARGWISAAHVTPIGSCG